VDDPGAAFDVGFGGEAVAAFAGQFKSRAGRRRGGGDGCAWDTFFPAADWQRGDCGGGLRLVKGFRDHLGRMGHPPSAMRRARRVV
jgi:hypothetical protein